MSYTPTNWANGKAPALNATNLNKIENELVKLDNIVSVPDITETTDTTMPNSYNGRLLVDEIGGVCEQVTTTGKNVLENTTLKNVMTSYGVTFTPNADGSITVNGTPSQWFPQAVNQKLLLTHGKEYVLSGCPSGGGYRTYYMYIEIKTSDGGSIVQRDEGNGVAFTYPTNATSAFIAIALNENVAVSNLVFKPMIREAGTDTTYEPYTGGQPAPSPSYPQEIKKTVVSGVKTHGRNYCPTYGHSGSAIVWLSVKAKAKNYVAYGTTFVKASGAVLFEVAGIKDGVTTTISSIGYASTVNVKNISTQGYDEVIVACYSNNAGNELKESFVYLYDEPTTETFVYEPYKESTITLSKPINLYGIGDVQDVIDIEKGVVIRNIGELNLEDLTWTHGDYNLWTSGAFSRAKGGTALMCETIEYQKSTLGNSINGTNVNYPYNIWARNGSTEISPSGKALYQLITPITETLPIADQIALNSLATYDGITYLEFDSEVQPTFEGEYGTSKVGGYTLEALLTARSK